MNFELSEEQIAVKEAARDFAQNVLKPGEVLLNAITFKNFQQRK